MDIKLNMALPGHNNPVYAVCDNPAYGTFFTAGNDKGIVEWIPGNAAPKRLLKPVPAAVYTMTVHNEHLFAGLRNGQVLQFDVQSGKLIKSFRNSEAGVFDLLILPHKNELLSADESGMVCVWDFDTGNRLHHWQASAQKVRSLAFHQQKNQLAAGSNDGFIRLYDAQDYSLQNQFKAHEMGITALAFSPDGNTLLSGSRDAHLKAWQTANWNCSADFAAHLFSIYRIIYHPAEAVLLSISRDKSFKLWDAADYRLLKNISMEKGHPSHRLSVNNVCWLDKGNRLVTVGDDKMVLLWDLTF